MLKLFYYFYFFNDFFFCRGLDVPSTESSREISETVFSSDVKSTKHQRPLSLGK
jgi:hypothetical protein